MRLLPSRNRQQLQSGNEARNDQKGMDWSGMPMKVLAFLMLGAHAFGIWPTTRIDQIRLRGEISHAITVVASNYTSHTHDRNDTKLHSKPLPPQLQQPACRRKCERHDNRLVFHGRPAGIVDREGVLFSLSNIAGYLCAKLHINFIQKNLQPAHNFGLPTPPEMRFEHLIHVTLVETGQPAYQEMMAAGLNAYLNRSTFDLEIATNRPHQAIPSFLEAEQAVFDNQSFVWEIEPQSNYYKWSTALLELFQQRTNAALKEDAGLRSGIYIPNTATADTSLPLLDSSDGTFLGCPYAALSFPNSIQRTADAVYQRLLHRTDAPTNDNPILGYLHIRQGDVASLCPTNTSILERYLSCSLKNTNKLGQEITLLFSSDLRNETERAQWQNISIYSHVQLQDLDALVQQELHRQVDQEGAPGYCLTTFYTFQVVRAIKQKAAFRFQRRKSICPSCARLPQHLLLNDSDPDPLLSYYGQFS